MTGHALAGTVAGIACVLISLAQAQAACSVRLRLLDTYSVPPTARVDGDLFGGISGLDYDSRTRRWYLVSDARSAHGPPRFFVTELRLDSHRIARVRLLASRRFSVSHVTTHAERGIEPIDAEAIRVDRRGNELLAAGEGDEARKIGPWIHRFDLAGRWLGELPLPPQLAATSERHGPGPNRSIEGLALASRGRELWIALEAPLIQDGPAADERHGADIRLTRLRLSDAAVSQYVYATDAARGHGPNESSDHGISEILALNADELLVLERSGIRGADGRFRFHSRLYCARLAGATDVASFAALSGQSYIRVVKQLLLDFDALDGVVAGNLEAMSFGPVLSRGRRSLAIASDNNFFDDVPTQLLLFAVQP